MTGQNVSCKSGQLAVKFICISNIVLLALLLVSPSWNHVFQSGKTVLANFLSGTTENVGGEYRPTQGVRILEFESHPEGFGDSTTCEVELWDCSGDFKFESCWPALMKDACGVVIIFNPDVPSHLKEIETWHSMFISSQGLQDNQCLLMAHHKPGSVVEDARLSLGICTAGLPQLSCELLSQFLV